jgi:hypothetical protein
MKKLFLGTMLLAMTPVFSASLVAQADVEINVSLPPAVVFAAPPAMVVLPETNVYVAPDANVDIFFYQGWWWRPWKGRWYRSQNYNSDWGYYRSAPPFYRDVPAGWRNDYRNHRWQGHPWNYQRVPHSQVQSNWRGWEQNRHWERQNSWGVQGWHNRPPAREGQPMRNVHQPPRQVQGAGRAQAGQPSRQETQVRQVQPHAGANPAGEERGRREDRHRE